MKGHIEEHTNAGCPIKLFKTADLPAPCTIYEQFGMIKVLLVDRIKGVKDKQRRINTDINKDIYTPTYQTKT